MNIIQAIVLGVIQGLTEFIPVSSSGHLVLAHQAMGITEHALVFDVALHFGTMLALVVFFNKELWELFLGLLGKNGHKKLAWLVVLATVPAAVSGYLLESAAEHSFRSVNLVALMLALVALLMLAAEKVSVRYERRKRLNQLTPRDSFLVGLAQAVAIIPGVSRSGSTITAGLFLGLDRVAATRFSFLLGIPIIAGAVIKVLLSGGSNIQAGQELWLMFVGITTAFISGLFAIKFLLKFLAKHSLAVFAYYRLGLAALVLLTSAIY